jgi:hypothetical protein
MMQRGERYQCTNEDCGCEISVTKASQLEDEEQAESPRCCCGEEMELMEEVKGSTSSRGSSARSR